MTEILPRSFRIRRCNGNRAAWILMRLNDKGQESDIFGSYTTALSLDSLLKYAGHLTPQAGDHVEVVVI